MQSNEIRKAFLTFFEVRNHRVVPSSSLVPANDPTLLFSNAGMNQFKDVFLGRERRDYLRATTSQKCVRAGGKHNDLEQVGRTTRHHTFFEMLGNFSFGDYFKKEAIPWAWELITKVFTIPSDKLYVTIFAGATLPQGEIPRDSEAYDCWRSLAVPADRIFELGMKENFWQMGETGPCGPCSEIHYDLGPAASDHGHADCAFPCDCGRYVELWNLVFMQFNRDEQGVMAPLPKPSIDTGAGLERLSAVLQGKLSNFETDLFRPLIDEAAALANVEYGANHDSAVSLRIIADHARASTFLISDGVLPSNEGRGYVLRRIMRRALYHGQRLGLRQPFMFTLSGTVVDMMKAAYPELEGTAHHVAKVIKVEEENYARLVEPATEILRERVEARPPKTQNEALEILGPYLSPLEAHEISVRYGPGKRFILTGDDLFFAYGTLGLRQEQVFDVAQSLGWLVIEHAAHDQFKALMQEERERARASWKGADLAKSVFTGEAAFAGLQKTTFDGYMQTTSSDCQIVALFVSEQVPAGFRFPSAIARGAGASVRQRVQVHDVSPGTKAEVVLDHTPFYAESGGQVGDTGHFLSSGGNHEVAQVTNTYYPRSGLIVHEVVVRQDIRVGDLVTAIVDAERRDATRRNHTATHLLHAALRKTLGTHVKQAGSLVAPDRLRFDFTHYTGLGEQDLLDIEDLVNERVLMNEEVVTTVMDLDTAVNTGAMALFGEKYADQVRVLTIDGFSKELCGGTHVRRTGDIGLFKIVSEGSVAAGTRRIEALTGTGVLEELRRQSQSLAQASEALHSKPDELIGAIEKLTESEKKLRKELEAQQMKRAVSAAGDLVQQAREVKGVRVVAARVEVTDRSAMRQMVDDLRAKLQSGVIVLGSVADGKVSLIAAVTKDLTAKLDAGKIVKQAATYVEGSGGGRKDLAEAGGKNPAKLDESIQAVPGIIEQML